MLGFKFSKNRRRRKKVEVSKKTLKHSQPSRLLRDSVRLRDDDISNFLHYDKRKPNQPLLRLDGSLEHIRSKSLPTTKLPRLRLSFDNTRTSSVCRRRENRRRFLFASGKAGRIKVKYARWNDLSSVVCERKRR